MARLRNNAPLEIIGDEDMTTYYTVIESPVDPLLLTSDGTALTRLYFVERKHGPEIAASWIKSDDAAPFEQTRRQLDAYFSGELTDFDLPLRADGTDFQRCVWKLLRKIPFGTTISYSELARRSGNPNASRAVGLANGRNPISLIVPCHRVIGVNGKLTGYGGGLPRKAALLEFESAVLAGGPHPMEKDEGGSMKDEG